jgi:hypothetical protein
VVDIIENALGSTNQAIKLAQDLRRIETLDEASYKLKIADLTHALSDIKLALTDAKEDLASRDAQIDELIRTNLKSPDRLIVRWGKAIVGGTLLVMVFFLSDYLFGNTHVVNSRYWEYLVAFACFVGGSFHGSRGKWI